MTKMMRDMAADPTGDVDRDFAAMMIPHHQGAIDMAVLELRYGRNEQLRRIAQEIIVDQQQEIAAMRLALGQPLPASVPAPAPTGRAAADGRDFPRDGPRRRPRNDMQRTRRAPRRSTLSSPVLARAGQAPCAHRAGHPDQPSRPRLRGRAVLQHGLGDRSASTTSCWA